MKKYMVAGLLFTALCAVIVMVNLNKQDLLEEWEIKVKDDYRVLSSLGEERGFTTDRPVKLDILHFEQGIEDPEFLSLLNENNNDEMKKAVNFPFHVSSELSPVLAENYSWYVREDPRFGNKLVLLYFNEANYLYVIETDQLNEPPEAST